MLTPTDSIRTEFVSVRGEIRSYLAQPDRPGPHPVVVLLHERYGLFQHTLDLAERFAREGYVCLAPDLYWRIKDQSALLAGEVTIPLPDPQVRDDLSVVYDYLDGLPSVDATRKALMGVCLTGRYAITVGAYRQDLKALVNFYGGAGPKEWPTTEHFPEPLEALFPRISAPVLGVFGEKDHVIPIPYVRQFRDCLERANKSYEITVYADMPHGWLNDRMPGRYRAEGAAAAWQQLMRFLARALSGGYPADRVQWQFGSDISTGYDPSKNVRLA